MANLGFAFSIKLYELTSSISIMKMLAEQAEQNVVLAVNAADEPGAVKEGEFDAEAYDENGESYPCTQIYYSCGSSVGYDYDDVKLEYKSLISSLTRRSAFLTMFGLFEHRINGCLEEMISLSRFSGDLKCKGPIEKSHVILKKGFEARHIVDIDHLTIIRNIMIHNDGLATDYHKTACKTEKKTEFEKRLLKAVKRTDGVDVNPFNGLIVDGRFLTYAVNEFNRYATELEEAIQSYHRQNPQP
ncbi:hypothetical protein PPUJ13061_51760 [Pseudomonas putida]|uniref:hypothetical protein n=1 Tax=Pseudomonas putida TaxID=303 RepID=UPI000E0DB423|nr:hypothetical protein [Pseudomonas putida]WQE52752.1 hypothetical protein U0028_23185 [Pseudomonas putida]GLO05274.1 hypothetical protein PPUJ13061_51760 [Pseudomonas putida]HDS1009320.1 hypothetical protein [Pseudomonas putida]